MISVNVKTAVTLAILGIVIFILLTPLYRGMVRTNPVYGIRIRKAFESEENWYKINRYGATALMYWAAHHGYGNYLLAYPSPVCSHVSKGQYYADNHSYHTNPALREKVIGNRRTV